MKKILLIRLNGLGDLICALPLYRSLQKKYPNAVIDLVLSDINYVLYPFINPNNKVHKVAAHGFRYYMSPYLAMELFGERYDLSIATKPSLDSKFAFITAIANAKQRVGVPYHKGHHGFWGAAYNHPVDAPDKAEHQVYKCLELAKDYLKPEDYVLDCSLEVFEHDLNNAKFFLGKNGFNSTDRFVLFQLSSTKKDFCRWPDENFVALGRRFQDEGYRVVINAMPKDKKEAESLAARMGGSPMIYSSNDMGEYLALLSMAHIVVGADGGGIHLSGAVGTKTVAFYSESNPAKWGAFNGDHLRFYTSGEPLSTITSDKVWEEIQNKHWL